MIRVTLRGYPPSLNKFAGRENTWEYRKTKSMWTDAVVYAVRAIRDRPKEPYPYAEVGIIPTRVRHDADNYCGKFLLDGLTKAGAIVDDNMAHIRLQVAGDYDKTNPRTVITVREAEKEKREGLS